MKLKLTLFLLLFPAGVSADPITIFATVATTAAGTAITSGVAAIFTATFVKTVISSVVISTIFSAFAPKPSHPKNLGISNERRSILRSSQTHRRLIYGETEVGGVLVYASVTSAGNDQYLHLVIVIAHQISEALPIVYLNGVPSTDEKYRGLVRIKTHLGTQQAADADLVAECAEVTEDHRFLGQTYAYLRLQRSIDIFPGGPPEVTFLIQGKADVFDPRTGAAGYTDNAALCAADYLRHPFGFNAPADTLHDLRAAANLAEESVPVPGGTRERRYRVSAVIDTSESRLSVLERFDRAMAGSVRLLGGRWAVVPGHAVATHPRALSADDLRGGIEYTTVPPLAERINAVQGRYSGPESQYQPTSYPTVTSEWETVDGRRLTRTMDFDFVPSPYQCQRLARIAIRQARQGVFVTWPGQLRCLQYQRGDVIAVNVPHLGWDRKLFSVTSLGLAVDGLGVDLGLAEYSPTLWTDSLDTIRAVDDAPNTNLPDPDRVAALTGLSIESGTAQLRQLHDGTVIPQMAVRWQATNEAYVRINGRIEIGIRPLGEPVYRTHHTPGADDRIVIADVLEGVTYEVRLRALNSRGVPGPWTETSHTVIGKTEPPGDVEHFLVDVTTFTWTPVPGLDIAGYGIRYHHGTSRDWASARPLHEGRLVAAPHTVPVLPGGPLTILIKAFDTSGNASERPAVILTDQGDPVLDNVIERHDLRARAWPGTLIGGTRQGGFLVAHSPNAMWTQGEAPMFSNDGNAPWWHYGAMRYETQIIPSPAAAGHRLTLVHDIVSDPFSIDYRRNGPEPMWAVDDGVPMFSDHDEAPVWHPPPWQPWPGRVTAHHEPFEFRITTTASGQPTGVRRFIAAIDVPDIIERLGDWSITALGDRLPLTHEYHAIVAVNLTLQGTPDGAVTARVVDKNPQLGPLVQCYDALGEPVPGLIDATIQGY